MHSQMSSFRSLPIFCYSRYFKKVKYQPKYITVNAWNEEAYTLFCNEVANSMNEWDIESDLFADPNDDYDHFEKIIQDVKTKYLSPNRVEFKKRKHNISPCITPSILSSIKGRDVLHQRLVATPNGDSNYNQLCEKLRKYKSPLKITIRLAKAKYYTQQFIKRICQTIDILGRPSEKYLEN